jgi:peptidoglycan/xylan/chitin deacetylase (PgdA/CDA1 family)
MTRKIALSLLVCTLALAGCGKIKLPTFGKKKPATPVPAVVQSEPAPPPSAASATEEPAAAPIDTHASVMVLCYHNIEDKGGTKALTISVSEFEEQLTALKEHGFTVIGMQDFLAWRRGEKDIPEKSCVITIDDGWVSGYTSAWPILKKLEYPFTLFIYVNYIGTGGKSLSWEQLAEMRDAGVDIQSHTYSHSNLRAPGTGVDAKTKALVQKDIQTLGKEGWLRKEIIDSRKVLEQRLGIKVNALAYPFGIHTAEARALVKEAGYEAAFTVYGQRLGYQSPADQLGRYAVEAAKPQIFKAALEMIGGGVPPSATDSNTITMNAASSMITVPMEGETISDPNPVIKANLATFGAVDPKSVEMRVSGIGIVPAKYDAETKMVEAKIAQKLREKKYTVIVTATAKGRKVQASWNFAFDPSGATSPVPVAEAPGR